MDTRVHLYTATVLGRDRVASPMLGLLYSKGEPLRYSFYRRLSGPQDQCGHEGVSKNLHPSDTQDRTQAIQLVVKCLASLSYLAPYLMVYCAIIPTDDTIFFRLCNIFQKVLIPSSGGFNIFMPLIAMYNMHPHTKHKI